MKKLLLKQKVQYYLDGIKDGKFEVIDNWLVYKKVNRYCEYAGKKLEIR